MQQSSNLHHRKHTIIELLWLVFLFSLHTPQNHKSILSQIKLVRIGTCLHNIYVQFCKILHLRWYPNLLPQIPKSPYYLSESGLVQFALNSQTLIANIWFRVSIGISECLLRTVPNFHFQLEVMKNTLDFWGEQTLICFWFCLNLYSLDWLE